MSDSEPSSPARYGELDDPGRDPKGLDPPRNPLDGGMDHDSGSGEPEAGPEGESQPETTSDEQPEAQPAEQSESPKEEDDGA